MHLHYLILCHFFVLFFWLCIHKSWRLEWQTADRVSRTDKYGEVWGFQIHTVYILITTYKPAEINPAAQLTSAQTCHASAAAVMHFSYSSFVPWNIRTKAQNATDITQALACTITILNKIIFTVIITQLHLTGAKNFSRDTSSLYVPFSALMLLAGWWERHPACNNTRVALSCSALSASAAQQRCRTI